MRVTWATRSRSTWGAAFDAGYSPDGRRIALRLNGLLATMPADGSAAPAVLVAQDTYGISWGG